MKDHVSYKDVLETLKSDIFGGKYASSRKFPSSTALARRFKATRFTIRQALDRLTQAGLIQSRKGCGTYVTVKAIPQKMGLIIPGLGCGEIFPPICQEISRLAQKRGLPLLFGGDSSSSPAVRAQRAMELARQFVEQGVSGVIFQPMEFYADAARYNKAIVSVFEKAGVPVVLLDCDIVPSPARSKCDIVGINNFEVGRRLALHLREQGAKRIRFLTKPLCAITVQDRIRGAQTVIGCQSEKEFVVVAEPTDEKAIRLATKGRKGADAFICGNDQVASRLLATLRKIGKRVPEDVLVTGVDDLDHASLVTPQLSTIHQPCQDLAALAFRFLIERFDNPSLPPRECNLPAPLVVRDSTRR